MLITLLASSSFLFALIALLLSIQLDRIRSSEKHKKETELFMVHELRSPIASIKAAATLILSLDEQLSKEKKIELLKVINSQSLKMLDYISLLLDTAKLQSGMFSIQKTPNDIKQIIAERVDLYMPLAMEKNITVTKQISEPIPSFYFDKQYIGQVISNLLSNSLKFTPQSGTITIAASFDGKSVDVSVHDTGAGLTEAEIANLFHKFYQVRHEQNPTGTGLGLYFTKGIVEAHKGTLHVESKVNEGTTIAFSLPFVPASQNSS